MRVKISSYNIMKNRGFAVLPYIDVLLPNKKQRETMTNVYIGWIFWEINMEFWKWTTKK